MISLEPAASQQLEQYAALVRQYAAVLDLSSPKHLLEFETAVLRCQPFADALEPNSTVLDIGSGAGLPAIPIAIMRPDVQITLCEIRSKRAAFLERCLSLLKLRHAVVHQGDVRGLSGQFDAVTALWLGSLKQIYELSCPRLAKNFSMMTRKGQELEQEWQDLQQSLPLELQQNLSLETRQLEQGSKLVIVKGKHGEGH
jgi:16S rRNA (guanine527-N7)-methyltransferase